MEEEARRKKQEERKQEEKKQGEGKTEEERKQSERSSSNGLLSVSFLSFASPLFDDVMISHSNTRTGDLWAAFSAASGEDIGALMNDWVDDVITRNNYVIYNKFVQVQFAGHPMLTVTKIGTDTEKKVPRDDVIMTNTTVHSLQVSTFEVRQTLCTAAGMRKRGEQIPSAKLIPGTKSDSNYLIPLVIKCQGSQIKRRAGGEEREEWKGERNEKQKLQFSVILFIFRSLMQFLFRT